MFFILFLFMWYTVHRTSIFFILFLIGLHLVYKYDSQKSNLGEWYIDKPTLFVLLCVFIIPVTLYALAEKSSHKIVAVSVATLVAVVAALLISFKKEREGDFKVNFNTIRSLSKDQLTELLSTLEEPERELVVQRFGLEGERPLSIRSLTGIYATDYKELKDRLVSIDEKLYTGISMMNNHSSPNPGSNSFSRKRFTRINEADK